MVRQAAVQAEQEAAKKAAAEAERQRLEAAAKLQEAKRRIAYLDEERRRARQEREARDALRRRMEERERRERETVKGRKERGEEGGAAALAAAAVEVDEGRKGQHSAEGLGMKGKLRMTVETISERRTGDSAPLVEKKDERRVVVELANGSMKSMSADGGNASDLGSSSSKSTSKVTAGKAMGEERGRGVRKIEVKFVEGKGGGGGNGKKGNGEESGTVSDKSGTKAAPAASSPATVTASAPVPATASTAPTGTNPKHAAAADSSPPPNSVQSHPTSPSLLSHLHSLSLQRLLQLANQLQAQAQSSPVTRPAVDLGFRVYEGTRKVSQQARSGVDAVRGVPGAVARVLEGFARDLDEGRGLASAEGIEAAVVSGAQGIKAAAQSGVEGIKATVERGVKGVGGAAVRGSEAARKQWKRVSEKVGGKWREAVEGLKAQG